MIVFEKAKREPPVVIPQRMALVNIDMQNCFVHGHPISAPGGLELLERINQLAAICRAAGMPVIHTSHVLRPDGSNASILAEIEQVQEGMINKDFYWAALHEGLVVEPNDILLDKPRFGAFHGTDLELILRTRGVDTIIIAGIATNVCCEMTTREAAARDFRVFFLSDGTATGGIGNLSSAEVHRASLATLGALFAQVITMDEMIEQIQQAHQ